jgi:hypothetical protein
MLTDYKFWYIRRNDDIHIDEIGIKVYEGDITTENEYDSLSKEYTPVTRYRRFNIIGTRRYTKDDFGLVSNERDLITFLNKELSKDRNRTPIKEQLWQL